MWRDWALLLYQVASSSIQPFGHSRQGRKLRALHLLGEAGSHLTQRHWAEAYLRTKCHLDPSSRLATIDMGRKLGTLLPFWGGGAGFRSNTMSFWLRPTQSSGILIHPAICPQYTWAEHWGFRPLLEEGELGSHLTQCRLGWGLPPCQVASWSIQPFGHNRYGQKMGAPPPFGRGGAGSPSNIMWPGPRPTRMQSFILSIQPFGHSTP